MKRSYEESGHSSGSKWSRRDTGLRMKYCLKALIPDVFASSNKGDFFPDTSLRVLGIYSDLSGAVAQALELILGRMKELAQETGALERM
eukprot:g28375.t1